MTEREQFIAWLNDAYSTEIAMLPVLKNHANDAKDYPEIYRRDMQHLAETRRQAERLEKMIKDLGGKISTTKTAIGKIFGMGQSISTEIFPDELIKNFLADFAAESFEIASYQSLIATAKLIGEYQCVPVLEESLAEEIAMARWIENNIGMATRESLKVTTGKNGSKSRGGKTRNKQSAVKKLTKPAALTTLLSAGAIGTGAYLLWQSYQNKTNPNPNRKVKNPNYRSLENNAGAGNNQSNSQLSAADQNSNRGDVDVVITETLVITEEPQVVVGRRATGGTNY